MNNKDVFACILRCQGTVARVVGTAAVPALAGCGCNGSRGGWRIQGQDAVDAAPKSDSISCKLGIRYPTLSAIMTGKKNIQTTLVIFNIRIHYDFISEIYWPR